MRNSCWQVSHQARANPHDGGAARGIRLPAPPGLPINGAVAAGSPLLAVENQRGTLPLPTVDAPLT